MNRAEFVQRFVIEHRRQGKPDTHLSALINEAYKAYQMIETYEQVAQTNAYKPRDIMDDTLRVM